MLHPKRPGSPKLMTLMFILWIIPFMILYSRHLPIHQIVLGDTVQIVGGHAQSRPITADDSPELKEILDSVFPTQKYEKSDSCIVLNAHPLNIGTTSSHLRALNLMKTIQSIDASFAKKHPIYVLYYDFPPEYMTKLTTAFPNIRMVKLTKQKLTQAKKTRQSFEGESVEEVQPPSSILPYTTEIEWLWSGVVFHLPPLNSCEYVLRLDAGDSEMHQGTRIGKLHEDPFEVVAKSGSKYGWYAATRSTSTCDTTGEITKIHRRFLDESGLFRTVDPALTARIFAENLHYNCLVFDHYKFELLDTRPFKTAMAFKYFSMMDKAGLFRRPVTGRNTPLTAAEFRTLFIAAALAENELINLSWVPYQHPISWSDD